MLKFLKYLSFYWWQVLLLFAGLIAQVWSSLQLPDMMSQIVNRGIVGSEQDFIVSQGVLMLGVTLLGGIGMVISGYFASRIGSDLARRLREGIFKTVMKFSFNEINNFSTSSLITRTTNDITQLQMVTTMVLRISMQAPLMGVGAVLKALDTAPSMSWIIMLAVGALLVVIITLFAMIMPKFKLLQKLIDKLNLVTRENLTGLRVVRAFNNEKHEEDKFDKTNQELNQVYLFINRAMAIMSPLIQLILSFTMLLIIWVGAKNIDTGNIEIGNMMAFMQYAMQVMMSFMFLTMTFILIPRATVSWGRVDEVLSTELSIKPAKNPKNSPEDTRGKIEFKNVTFSYANAEAPVLENISFKTHAGQTTAIIGSTGSGKSTLVNLIPRFYDTTSGEILIDDINIRDYAQDDLIAKIGYVPQKGVLFSGTVKSNIAFGATKADDKQIKKAAKIAQAYNFIEKLDGKFDATIAQGGTNVSGGQKQRLSIARAIAKDPEIYIFDDSFSALDLKTDLALREALQTITRGSAVLVVAQRVSTIKHADQIIVLNKGKIAGIGTHYDLLTTCPVYKEIASSQLSEAELKQELRAKKVVKK